MEQEINKWSKIYSFISRLEENKPWDYLSDNDIFILVDDKDDYEYFFSFFVDATGKKGIAIYKGGNNYFSARERMRTPNTKHEPVFYLQNAIVILWDDRDHVSKQNRAIIKALGYRFRGHGKWIHVEQYREGYAPRFLPDAELDRLSFDMEQLCCMLSDLCCNGDSSEFAQNQVLVRRLSKLDNQYHSIFQPLFRQRKSIANPITMEENDWIRTLKRQVPRGTISIDWSYSPLAIDYHNDMIFPRLLLAVENSNGAVIKRDMVPPSDKPYNALLSFFDDIIQHRGKPSAIEVSDAAIFLYLQDICEKAGIHLIHKQQLKRLRIVQKRWYTELEIISEDKK